MFARLLFFCGLFIASTSAMAVTIYKSTDASGVVSYSDRPTKGSSVFTFRDRMVENLERQVYLVIMKKDGVDSVYVRNDLYAPVEIELSFTGLNNVSGAPSRPIRRVMPLRSSIRLAQLTPTRAGRPLAYLPKFEYSLGDPEGAAVAYRYPYPWRGGPFRVSQGAEGQYSHFGPRNRYAIDIAMPEGTPIIAARGGIVVKTENGQTGRGTDPSGNFVRVLHDDGTMGVYLHLQKGSVSVREGQRVVVGSPLALSGNTGNSSGPHLHFVVQRNTGMGLVSIPYQFKQPMGALPNFALGKQ
ncbi:M23 family metallopeptidase [Pseudomonas umsongensis]|jgi:murein DD-endopeptidase MepM/ murein hydrolase activator NlpD|uniref:Peptidase M23 n=1 Tax=Pseudomonas umsongensis TaxID=198618 RepID=A0ABX4DTF3_9PSED|nr:peptidoglycan DD-metalloendopeptidase family protein [Pseudomonas umsongensis]MBT9572733.1 peptidoglycan DD-metalloendopeptidase family protein [Pseudomonas umsongensis]OXR31418.1 peptidase M23 [Pseudomonas umsongensis]QFG33164.1 M23 family metallopeptidase [Pseudomonas umsongensis]SDT73849.1 Murein DD-endopeptidase MepM and murein hydrolase activator NlpD, contain LysM domain [Pseudomonas umsongensis]